jgi:hypothetical protein
MGVYIFHFSSKYVLHKKFNLVKLNSLKIIKKIEMELKNFFLHYYSVKIFLFLIFLKKKKFQWKKRGKN